MSTRGFFTVASTVALGIAGALTPISAGAWFIPEQFCGTPWRTSGGNFYTGSPRSIYSCDGCHYGAENFPAAQRIQLGVTTQRVNGAALENYDLFGSGYVPGERYKITIDMLGEHRGHYAAGGYEDPAGTFWKNECPATDPAGAYLAQVHNRNQITAEVVDEDGNYADDTGNAAGRLRPDAQGGPTAEGSCINTNRCTGGQDPPPRTEVGGPTSAMFRHWVVDPNANPPFGDWSCGVCDALVTNYGDPLSPADESGFDPVTMQFFWTAPSTAPATEGGRIRFYMAAVDGDGYSDTLDDDFAAVKVAVCPAGAGAACDPVVGPGWGLGLLTPPHTTTASPRPARSVTMGTRTSVSWVPAWGASLFVVLALFGLQRRRRRATLA